MHSTREMQTAWAQYWRNANFESLPKDQAGGLGALDSTWGEFFSALPDGARMLDLATGGGAVIRRAIAVGRNFKISGVDIADLSAVSVTLPEVEFIGNTELSHLPFPDDAFDAVTSQFGIEYAEPATATREAVRVLVRGGRGHFVLHHAEGAITQGVAANLAVERAAFTGNNAFALAKAVFELRQRSAPQSEIMQAEAALRNAVAILQSRLRDDGAFGSARNVVGFLAEVASEPEALPPPEALHRLDLMEEQIRARSLRRQSQLDAALDRKGIEKFAEHLTAAGAVVSAPGEVKYPMGRPMAWSLSFHKDGS